MAALLPNTDREFPPRSASPRLVEPEYWEDGLDDWAKAYEARLPVFLEAMTEAEDDYIASGKLQEEQRLSGKMRESWVSGGFWTVYAAWKNFAFDSVYWRELDSRFFGPVIATCDPKDMWKERLGLLDQQTQSAIESFVERKMLETETRVLAWDPDEYTLEYQAALRDGK